MEIKVFEKEELGKIKCFEKDGIFQIQLEDAVRGLGFTRVAKSGNIVVRWDRVKEYLKQTEFVPASGYESKDFGNEPMCIIPEWIEYAFVSTRG